MTTRNTFASSCRMSKTSIRPSEKKNQTEEERVILIFKDAIKYTEDTFWKNKLMDASKGIFPKFFSFRNNELIHEKTKNVVLIENDGSSAANAFIEFLKEKEKIFSPADIQNMNLNDKFIEPPKQKNWSNYMKKDREHMVDYFIESIQECMKLNYNEVENLKRTILEGIDLKVFDKNNIFINKDNRIEKIDGLNMTKDRTFVINKSLMDKCVVKKAKEPNSKYISDQTRFLPKWMKYIENLDKSYKKSNCIIPIHDSIGE